MEQPTLAVDFSGLEAIPVASVLVVRVELDHIQRTLDVARTSQPYSQCFEDGLVTIICAGSCISTLLLTVYLVFSHIAFRLLALASEPAMAATAERKPANSQSPELLLTCGSSPTGFGTNQGSSPFGAKTGFGSGTTGGGSLFGSNTATTGTSTGFGGFGGTNNSTNPTSTFGNNNTNTGGGLFGSGGNKPAFGTGTTSGGSLFGGNNAFGAANNQTSSVFGAPQSTALGGNNADCQGTGTTPFQAYTEKEGGGSSQTNHFQSISFMPPYQKFSFEVSNSVPLLALF